MRKFGLSVNKDTFKYNNAIVRIHGDVAKDDIKDATVIFINKVRRRKSNVNRNSSRVVNKKQILDR